MPHIAQSPLQKLVILFGLVCSIVLHHPLPELDMPYFTELATNYNSKGGSDPLSGVTIVVTGATSGIGLGLTRKLHGLGAKIIAIGRSENKLKNLESELNGTLTKKRDSRVVTVLADFEDLESVAVAANQIKSKFESIDFLVNNAGIGIWGGPTMKTVQGYELSFGVNYLSHFLLTEKLLPLLSKSTLDLGAKIIQVSSTSHQLVDGSDLKISSSIKGSSPIASDPAVAKGNMVYPNSKLAQIYHARALNKKLSTDTTGKKNKIRTISICPSFVSTKLTTDSSAFLDLFMFDDNGFGLSSILFAMFHPGDASKETDYVKNNEAWIPELQWADAIGIRSFFIAPFVPILFFIQKLIPSVEYRKSSPKSYDHSIQMDLYDWSKEAVSPWI